MSAFVMLVITYCQCLVFADENVVKTKCSW